MNKLMALLSLAVVSVGVASVGLIPTSSGLSPSVKSPKTTPPPQAELKRDDPDVLLLNANPETFEASEEANQSSQTPPLNPGRTNEPQKSEPN